ncbi:TetR/AcrR family transcriptional regulator [Microbispora bryophytorum]|uniref:TetR/AcrR family transcriptional regulator n=1 Tax=Microbispora bryophytorum TaxID=1460882 RepID=UPI0033EAA84B
MSPRTADPAVRTRLIEAAARLLEAEGRQALTTRRLAAEVGVSTMAVYTHFGGMDELVTEVVRESYSRLGRALAGVQETADPVTDLMALCRAYRRNALANTSLYATMLGFTPTSDDQRWGAQALQAPLSAIRRCLASGRFRPAEPLLLAHQAWCGVHGLVTLELGGYFFPSSLAEQCFEGLLRDFAVGAGDTVEAAARSLEASRSSRPGPAAAV